VRPTGAASERNLRKHALEYAVSSARIVVSNISKRALTPAVMSLADLMLDTLVHNTPPDLLLKGLWAGLAIVTYGGESLHQRTSVSALKTLGLTLLVTRSVLDYEALAVKLARNPDKLASIQLRLRCSRPLANYSDLDPCACDPQQMAGEWSEMAGEWSGSTENWPTGATSKWRPLHAGGASREQERRAEVRGASGCAGARMGLSQLWQPEQNIKMLENVFRLSYDVSLASGRQGSRGDSRHARMQIVACSDTR